MVIDNLHVFIKYFKHKLIEKTNAFALRILRILRIIKPTIINIYRALPNKLKVKCIQLYFSAHDLLGLQSGDARCYVHPDLSRINFFQELNRRNIQYVLLRWWHEFPDIPDGEDMDILMPLRDLNRIRDLVVLYPTKIPCDIYTVNGDGPGHYLSIPYFSRNLSEKLLSERYLYRDTVYVPSDRMYFASLAYHAIYHKGSQSGLPGFDVDYKNLKPEHDYGTILQQEIDKHGIDVELSVRSLVSWLKREGFAPNRDTLAKLVDARKELSFLLEKSTPNRHGGEVCVFIVREKGEEEGISDYLIKLLHGKQMEILRSVLLNGNKKEYCTKYIRGGNWNKGDGEPVSGGPPARIIIAFDYHPKPLTAEQSREQTWVTNAHVLEAKMECRRIVKQLHFITKLYNPVHTADNEVEALEYIKIAFPEEYEQIIKELEEIRARHFSDLDVIDVSTRRKQIVTFG